MQKKKAAFNKKYQGGYPIPNKNQVVDNFALSDEKFHMHGFYKGISKIFKICNLGRTIKGLTG